MKKKRYKKNIIILLCIIAITVLFIFIYNNKQKKEVLFLAIYSDLCDRQKKIYIEEDGINIYTICIDNILTNKKENLKQKIVNGKMKFNELYQYANKTIKYSDGGSVQYIYDNFTINKCNSFSGRKDIIITRNTPDISICK